MSRAFSGLKYDMPSISVITLPFPCNGGRFIYEHPDGRREYVDAVFSSPFGTMDQVQNRGDLIQSPAQSVYDDTDKGTRPDR